MLAGLLELELGARVSPGNTFITFADGAAESSVAIRQAIDALAAGAPLGWADAARFVDPASVRACEVPAVPSRPRLSTGSSPARR